MNLRFVTAIAVVVIALGVLMSVALRSTAKSVVTVAQLKAEGARADAVQLGARVAEGSEIEVRAKPERQVRFLVAEIGNNNLQVPVTYYGMMPDTLKTGRDVILQGTYDGQEFKATSLLTQCPSKYEPPMPGEKKERDLMIDVGNFALILAWLLTVYSAVIGSYAALKRNAKLTQSAAVSVQLTAAFSVLALVILAIAFVRHDYRYVYVWQHSNNAMPVHYLVSAIWGGMDGSMLLWAAIMALFALLVVRKQSQVPRELFAWVVPVLALAVSFFLFVTSFLTNPFRISPAGTMPFDGNGLNPLLQNPSMMIHPPMLYLGFTGFVVPFAFCFAALLSGCLTFSWIQLTKRWTLIAWGFLTTGIILGGNWAYIELGWGGFWAWDPVENASFLPWLTGTAYLHSAMVQEQRGMLKVWNVCLAVLTYGLTVFGTFLTRSGIVQSVHAFAETDVGWVFLLYLAIIAATVVLLAYRWSALRPERKIESFFSREAAFLFNNLILLGITFATFWGVMFPVLSEAVTGEKSVVGPPFFNQVNVPLFLALLFLMGIGPLIAWRKSSMRQLLRLFALPLVSGSALTILFIAIDPSRIYAAVSFGLSLFVLLTIEAEFRRAVKVRRQLAAESITMSMTQVVKRKPRRYGGFLVHLGVCVMAVAITASSAYKLERDIVLNKGQSLEIGRYELTLDELSQGVVDNYSYLIAAITVKDGPGGRVLTVLRPERRVYSINQEVTTEVALRVSPLEDLYLALAGLDIPAEGSKESSVTLDTAPALFKVFINPLQVWLWFGGVVTIFGSVLVMLQSVLRPVVEHEQDIVSEQASEAIALAGGG